MLYNAVMEGKTSGIYVTLEQGKDSLGSHMAGMGMDVQDPRVRSKIAIIDLADLRVQLDAQEKFLLKKFLLTLTDTIFINNPNFKDPFN